MGSASRPRNRRDRAVNRGAGASIWVPSHEVGLPQDCPGEATSNRGPGGGGEIAQHEVVLWRPPVRPPRDARRALSLMAGLQSGSWSAPHHRPRPASAQSQSTHEEKSPAVCNKSSLMSAWHTS